MVGIFIIVHVFQEVMKFDGCNNVISVMDDERSN